MNSATQITSARPSLESIIQAATEKLSNELLAVIALHRQSVINQNNKKEKDDYFSESEADTDPLNTAFIQANDNDNDDDCSIIEQPNEPILNKIIYDGLKPAPTALESATAALTAASNRLDEIICRQVATNEDEAEDEIEDEIEDKVEAEAKDEIEDENEDEAEAKDEIEDEEEDLYNPTREEHQIDLEMIRLLRIKRRFSALSPADVVASVKRVNIVLKNDICMNHLIAKCGCGIRQLF